MSKHRHEIIGPSSGDDLEDDDIRDDLLKKKRTKILNLERAEQPKLLAPAFRKLLKVLEQVLQQE